MITTRSVLSSVKARPKRELRILVARFRGRNLPQSRYDIWMPNLGPSEGLLRAFQHGRINWDKFSRYYRMELFDSGPLDEKNHTIKNHGQKFTLRLLKELARQRTLTLLCHCAEKEPHCHRHLLRKILEGVF